MAVKPRNFSFIDQFIAGSAFPYSEDNINFFLESGINNIVSITWKKLSALETHEEGKFNHLQLAVHGPPIDENTINDFINFLQNAKQRNEKVVVHCEFGQERTGILLAIYLVKLRGFNIQEAIEEVKEKRPHSLQTESSIQFLLEIFSQM